MVGSLSAGSSIQHVTSDSYIRADDIKAEFFCFGKVAVVEQLHLISVVVFPATDWVPCIVGARNTRAGVYVSRGGSVPSKD